MNTKIYSDLNCPGDVKHYRHELLITVKDRLLPMPPLGLILKISLQYLGPAVFPQRSTCQNWEYELIRINHGTFKNHSMVCRTFSGYQGQNGFVLSEEFNS